MVDIQSWVITETKSVNFGDKRLNKRFGELLDSFSDSPSKSIPGSLKSWNETIAAYRFCNNQNVTHHEILSPHKSASIDRIKKEEIVLMLQDTTEIDFTGRKSLKGIGYLNSEHRRGFYLHPTIAVTPNRLCLGVTNIQLWTRDTVGTYKERRKKPIEDKETYCWIKGYESANEIALSAPNTTIVSVSDRASDIYELLQKSHSELNKAYWLIRANYDRCIADKNGKKLDKKLKQAVGQSAVIGEIEFQMPPGKIYSRELKRDPRAARTVKQAVKACTVYLKPTGKKESGLVAVNVVHCEEINPPSAAEKIEWFLLTSYPITNSKTAMDIVNWYLCRWQIEIFFKILKSGCKVEDLQFETMNATTNCLALYLIIAWRVLYLTMLGRNCPNLNCSEVFEENEWKAVYSIVKRKRPPAKPPKLNEIILMIAKLGGFLGRKADGFPGATVMWTGIQRMRDFTLAWEIFGGMT